MLPNTLGLEFKNCCYIGNIPGEQSGGVQEIQETERAFGSELSV